MRKYTKEYTTPYIPGLYIYQTSQLADLRKVVSLTFVNNETAVRLRCRYYRKKDEVHIIDMPKDISDRYGSLVLRYEAYQEG